MLAGFCGEDIFCDKLTLEYFAVKRRIGELI